MAAGQATYYYRNVTTDLYRTALQNVILHETLPGHHLQVQFLAEHGRKGNHPIARLLFFSGPGEGWATYAEDFANEIGLYDSDRDYIGSQMSSITPMMVVDLGMQVKGWTAEQSIQYLQEAMPLRPPQRAKESVALIGSIPGFVLSYPLGGMKWHEMRERVPKRSSGRSSTCVRSTRCCSRTGCCRSPLSTRSSTGGSRARDGGLMASNPRARRSLAGRIVVVVAATAAIVAAVTLVFDRWLESPVLAGAAALLVTLPLAVWFTNRMFNRWSHSLRAVADGISSLRDRDFSVSVTPTGPDEIGDLTAEYNSLGESLRRERLNLYQRELLLDTVVQTTPLALVLTNANDHIVFGNIAARQLFRAGRKIEGIRFGDILEQAPQPLRDAVAGGVDTLFTVSEGTEAEIFHLSNRPFSLNSQPHRLLLFKQLTREMAAQEVAIWKKVIRVIAHELNNSLAPISSLAHSGRELALQPDTERLTRVFSTIEERASHLATFIDGYARFAKLPRPRPAEVHWGPMLAGLKDSLSFRVVPPLPVRPAWMDGAQIEQVLINLVKNAGESGSPEDEVTLTVAERDGGFAVEVRDRGSGPHGRSAARRAAAVLLDQAQGDRARAHAVPRDRGCPRRAALHRQSRGRRRDRHRLAPGQRGRSPLKGSVPFRMTG